MIEAKQQTHSFLKPNMIVEKITQTPVVYEADVCVVGGSCTGVFAAVRAARRGLRVALIEQNVIFGGMATAAMVNEWHSLFDMKGETQIIGGLTEEVLARLRKRQAVISTTNAPDTRYRFNSAELALELDELVCDHKIRPFLSARCVAATREGNHVDSAIIEDKSGRRAIRARVFIDTSGDGDLLRRAGFYAWKNPVLQPVNSQQLVGGLNALCPGKRHDIWSKVRHLSQQFGYPLDNASPWFFDYPSSADVTNVFGPRLNNIDASDADQLTLALIEGRRLHRALLDMIRAELSPDVSTIALAHGLGVRDTWHAHCFHQLIGKEVLYGNHFSSCIACGTYPVDLHSAEGTILRYLDGTEKIISRDNTVIQRRWRDEAADLPQYYQIPFHCLVPKASENFLIAGRLMDADREAFGAIRVMVNMNQTGEAAGEAAALSIKNNCPILDVPIAELRANLNDGGSRLPRE